MSVLAEVVDGLVAVDPTTLDEVSLGESIVDLEVQIRRLQAVQADRLRVFDAKDAAVADGMGTASGWLATRVDSLGHGEAKSRVALGRAMRELPAMAAALAEGAVSPAHLRILARHTRPVPAEVVADAEEFLAGLARQHDPRTFSWLVARWVMHVAPDAAEQAEQRRMDRRGVSLARTLDDVWHLAGLLDPEGGLRLFKVLEARAQPAGPEDTRTKDQRWADALTSLADEALAHGQLPTTAGHRPEIVVHLPAPRDGQDRAVAELDGAGPITDPTLERIACDARMRALVLDGLRLIPTALGRAERRFPPPLRKLIVLRDGGCRYGNCPMPASACEAHHVRWWEHGGETCLDNGVLLCRWHHHCVHTRGHDLKLLPDGTAEVTLIINLPGSPKAVIENLQTIAPALPHAVQLLRDAPTSELGHHAA